MKNPKSEIRDPNERRSSKLEPGTGAPTCSRLTVEPEPDAQCRLQTGAPGRRLLLFSLLPLAFCLCAQAQYSIDWSTIDGGGGTSTGGVYSVTGTIGQPDAGAMSGGNYTLQGGFWGIITAVQTPGAPYLWVMRTTTNTVAVWWPVSETSWQLQAATNLVPPGSTWTSCSYQTNGANCVFIETPPTGNRFYRLSK